MKKRMIQLLSMILVLSMLLCLPAMAAEPGFRFSLSSEGKSAASLTVGETLTVDFALQRTDSTDPWTMYAWQTEISYDASAFHLVENSVKCANGVSYSLHDGNGVKYVYFNTYSQSASGTANYPASLTGCSFQLKALKTGSFTVAANNNKVSTAAGADVYPATAQDLTVTVTNDGKDKEKDEKAPDSVVWDGISVDVGWYLSNPGASAYTISSAAELAGVAALVNGLVNANCEVYTGGEKLSAARWNTSAYVRSDTGTSGANNQSTDTYHFGTTDFAGVTITLAADLDMSAGNYMPIGGQYLMTDENTATKIDASFCGVLDGGEHNVTVSCNRHCSGNYGDGQSIGLVGRLGLHDNEAVQALSISVIGVKNLAVYGSVKGNRSVGGVVGKIGKNNGAVIENCANFASVTGTDAKGTGGIVGAGWNGGTIKNCYNAGAVTNTQHAAVAGISGSNESEIINCYNRGKITGPGSSATAAIASENGGGSYINCYWLDTSASVGVYNKTLSTVMSKTAAELKSDDVLNALGSAFAEDGDNVNGGYPVLVWQVGAADDADDEAERAEKPLPFTDVTGHWASDAIAYVYRSNLFSGVSDTRFDPDGFMTRAMLVTVLYRMEGKPAVSGSNPFQDVAAGKWYTDAVVWAKASGIVDGYDATHFGTDDSVTREQIAAILMRYAAKKGFDVSKKNDLTAYTDAKQISAYALQAVQWANAMNLITGRTATTIVPKGTATRAEVASILMRYQQNITK